MPQRLATFAALEERMNALPGVTGASVGRVVPFALSGTGATRVVLAPGEAASPTAGTPVFFNQVDESFFRLMGVGLLQGRAIGKQDTADSQRVVVVNRTLARKLFGDNSAVGKHIRIGRDQPIDLEIVGIAQDGKYNDVTEPSRPYLYLPVTQDAWAEGMLIVTTAGDPSALLPVARKAIRETDPSILIGSDLEGSHAPRDLCGANGGGYYCLPWRTRAAPVCGWAFRSHLVLRLATHA
jgi:hypothetical protein